MILGLLYKAELHCIYLLSPTIKLNKLVSISYPILLILKCPLETANLEESEESEIRILPELVVESGTIQVKEFEAVGEELIIFVHEVPLLELNSNLILELKKALPHSILNISPGSKTSPPLGSNKTIKGSASTMVKSESLESNISLLFASVTRNLAFSVGVLGTCQL